jgi:hypothetical protein
MIKHSQLVAENAVHTDVVAAGDYWMQVVKVG